MPFNQLKASMRILNEENIVDINKQLYKEFIKQGHHYIYAQPFLSTLFLLGVMKNSRMYIDKDIELFFLTSYFKDIGMSAIPTEKYNQENLDDEDKKLLSTISVIVVVPPLNVLYPNWFLYISGSINLSLT